jgi:hypothetical protein
MSEDDPARAFELAAADFVALAPRLWDPLGRILVQHAAPRIRDRLLARISELNLTVFDAGSLVATGTRA